MSLDAVLAGIRACRACADELPHEPRPVVRVSPVTRLLICGQAPGRRVHESGLPFDDPSGDRLRSWLGVDRETFYGDPSIGVAAMAFCCPGTDPKGGDYPPPRRCAQLWRSQLLAQLPKVERNTDNATAAAFRSAHTCVVKGSEQASGALAVPLMAPAGCVGVLAIELPRGSEQRESMRALVTILAAQLARVVAAVRPAETADAMPGWSASELSDVAQAASIRT